MREQTFKMLCLAGIFLLSSGFAAWIVVTINKLSSIYEGYLTVITA